MFFLGLCKNLFGRLRLVTQIRDHPGHANGIIIDPAVDGFSDEVAITLRISLGPGRERRLPRFRGGFVHPVVIFVSILCVWIHINRGGPTAPLATSETGGIINHANEPEPPKLKTALMSQFI